MIKTLSSELVMTLTNTFPTAPGMAPKESANSLRHTLYWLHCTKKNGNFCHVPFCLLWNPSEAGVGGVLHSRVLLWVPRNGNFCLTNLLWHILSSMLSSSGLVVRISPLCIQCSPLGAIVQDRRRRKMHSRSLFSPRKPPPMAPSFAHG